MALSYLPALPQGIRSGYATTTAAIGTITGTAPTNTVLLLTANTANGSIITKITATPRATAAANVLVLWGSLDGGTTKYVIAMKVVASDTVSTTDPAVTIDFGYTIAAPLFLSASGGVGESLYVGNTVADPASGYVWRCEGRDM